MIRETIAKQQIFLIGTTLKQAHISAYRPTKNGQLERWNAILVDETPTLAFEKDWELSEGLSFVAYRDSTHEEGIRPDRVVVYPRPVSKRLGQTILPRVEVKDEHVSVSAPWCAPQSSARLQSRKGNKRWQSSNIVVNHVRKETAIYRLETRYLCELMS
jgi:hypothetical protein